VGLIQCVVSEIKTTHVDQVLALVMCSQKEMEPRIMNQTQTLRSSGRTNALVIAFLLATSLLVIQSAAAQGAGGNNAGGNNAFGFNSDVISGFLTGKVLLTGGGAINFKTKDVHAGGSFTCLEGVEQGPLTGCKSGEGVRWDTANVLTTVGFKCTGAAAEVKKTATTSTDKLNPDTVVLQADFYRAGDGNDESFSGQMIVSNVDLAPEIPGIQNVWIEKVGCGSAIVNFNH
jgi:hypothetical protein